MSKGNRGPHALFGVTLVAYLIFGGAILGAKERESIRSIEAASATDGQPQAPLDPAVRADVVDQSNAAERRQNSDLQAQWHAANASWAGVWVSFWGLAGLAVTAYLAGLALREAKRSADADNEALRLLKEQRADDVKTAPAKAALANQQLLAAKQSADAALKSAQAADALANQDRAWIFVEVGNSFDSPMRVGGAGPIFEAFASVTLRNYGRTLAVIKSVVAEYYWPIDGNSDLLDPQSERATEYQARVRPSEDMRRNVPREVGVDSLKLPTLVRFPKGGRWDFDEPNNGREVLLHPGEAGAVRLRFKWDELQGEQFQDRHLHFFLCRVFYEDVRGNQCETSAYLYLGPGAGSRPIDGPINDTKWNYRK